MRRRERLRSRCPYPVRRGLRTSRAERTVPRLERTRRPLNTPVKRDDIYLLKTAEAASKLPNALVPKTMHNEGNYIISRQPVPLARPAGREPGCRDLPGFAAQKH